MTGRIIGSGERARYLIDGQEVTKEAFDAAFPDKPIGEFGGHLAACWPMVSDTLAVHPDQVQEAMADAAATGTPVRFLDDGRPVFQDREQFRRYCEPRGYYARNGGYGDPRRK